MVNNSLNPVFNELVRLPVRVPVLNDKLTIKVSDYDHGGYDDLVADCVFSLNDIVAKKTLPPRWVPLYGIGGLGDLAACREALPHAQLETCYKVSSKPNSNTNPNPNPNPHPSPHPNPNPDPNPEPNPNPNPPPGCAPVEGRGAAQLAAAGLGSGLGFG